MRDIATRTVVNMVPETATWIDIGFTDVEVSEWSMDYGRTFHAHHRMTADPAIATTQLVAMLQERIGRNADLADKIATRPPKPASGIKDYGRNGTRRPGSTGTRCR